MNQQTDRLSSAQLTVRILKRLQDPDQSLRLAMAKTRKSYEPRNTRLWGEVHAWVMEINKHQITIDHIEKLLLEDHVKIKGTIKPFIDLATYWWFWGRRKIVKVNLATERLFREEKQRQPRWLEQYLKKLGTMTLVDYLKRIPEKDERWAIQYSLPVLLYRNLQQLFNHGDLVALGEWFNKPALKYFWINKLQAAPEEILEKLSKKMQIKPVSSVPGSYLLKKGRPLQYSGVYNQGKVLLQDVAATAVTQLLPLVPGQLVLDTCAAPGNKTIQLLAREPKINLVAGDLPGSRYSLLIQRLCFLAGDNRQIPANNEAFTINVPREGATIHVKAWDARSLPYPNFSVDSAFIDAPCTGTGTLGTKPDLRKSISSDFVKYHLQLQKAILLEAKRVVKPGGRILYVTCSLLPEENEEMVKWFLNKETGEKWQVEPLYHSLAEKSPLLEGSLRFFPPRSQSEGFFACLLKRGVKNERLVFSY